jgi:hypothetical protein
MLKIFSNGRIFYSFSFSVLQISWKKLECQKYNIVSNQFEGKLTQLIHQVILNLIQNL